MSEVIAEGTATEPVEGATPEAEETLGDGGKKALQAEREARKAAAAKAAELEAKLRELEDRDKSEEERAAAERDRLQAEIAALQVTKVRAEVAAARGVPVEILAGPVSGDEADVQAFAEALLAWRSEGGQRLVVPAEGLQPAATRSRADLFSEALDKIL